LSGVWSAGRISTTMRGLPRVPAAMSVVTLVVHGLSLQDHASGDALRCVCVEEPVPVRAPDTAVESLVRGPPSLTAVRAVSQHV
jgi:hypothetical protein